MKQAPKVAEAPEHETLRHPNSPAPPPGSIGYRIMESAFKGQGAKGGDTSPSYIRIINYNI